MAIISKCLLIGQRSRLLLYKTNKAIGSVCMKFIQKSMEIRLRLIQFIMNTVLLLIKLNTTHAAGSVYTQFEFTPETARAHSEICILLIRACYSNYTTINDK